MRSLPACAILVLVLAACTAGAACMNRAGPAGPVTPVMAPPDMATPAPAPQPAIPLYRYEVVHVYPHDPGAFTEGLAWDRGELVESTGLPGNSTIRRMNLTTGKVIAVRHLPLDSFGEGTTVIGKNIAQLDLESGTGTLYNADTFDPAGTFRYTGYGWGLTHDNISLVMSNGTPYLTFLDPQSFYPVRTVMVTARGKPVENLNELEYVRGEIYANLYPTNTIVRISPDTGKVTGIIDLTGLLSPDQKKQVGDASTDYIRQKLAPEQFAIETCPNGIAYDAVNDRLFVTGKFWPALFEIRLVPA